jgi:hypothetical protein
LTQTIQRPSRQDIFQRVGKSSTSRLKAEYMKLYDDAAKLYREACLAHNEQRILQNRAIMVYLDECLAELGEA